MANVTFKINLSQDKADTNSANSAVNIKVDGATVASATEVTSTDLDNPTEIEFTVNDLTEASHSMEIEFTNPYYVDSTDYRKITLGSNSSYITAYDTYKDGVQKENQDKMSSASKFPVAQNIRNFNDSWTAMTIDGNAVADSGDTAYDTNSFYMYDGSIVITFTYANNGYNEYPYRAVLDATTTPPTLSTTITVPFGDDVVNDPSSAASRDASKSQFAAA